MKRQNVIRRKGFGDGGGEATLKICVIQYTRHLPCMKHYYCAKLMSGCKTITNDAYLDSGE